MRKSYLIAIVVSVALGLIVLFLLFPTQPKSALDKANSPIADSVKIQQAIELVNGPQPMQGIQMLLSMIDESQAEINELRNFQIYLVNHYDNIEIPFIYVNKLFEIRPFISDLVNKHEIRIKELEKQIIPVHFVLGEFAIRSGQMEKAVARFNTIINLQPQNTLAYIYKGEALMQMDSLETALATFKAAIATDSTSGIALVYAGKMNEQLGNFSEAKTLYNQILRHNEDPIVRDSVNAFIKKIDIKLNNK